MVVRNVCNNAKVEKTTGMESVPPVAQYTVKVQNDAITGAKKNNPIFTAEGE